MKIANFIALYAILPCIVLLGSENSDSEPVLNIETEDTIIESYENIMLSLDADQKKHFSDAFQRIVFYELNLAKRKTEQKEAEVENSFQLLHKKNAEEVIEIADKLGQKPAVKRETVEINPFWPRPKFQVTIAKENLNLIFEFKKENINGLLEMAVWKTNEPELIWFTGLGFFNGEKLRMGEIPKDFTTFNGNKSSAKQYFPETDIALEYKKHDKLIISIKVQHDIFIGAASTTYYYVLSKKEDEIIMERLKHRPRDSQAILEQMNTYRKKYRESH